MRRSLDAQSTIHAPVGVVQQMTIRRLCKVVADEGVGTTLQLTVVKFTAEGVTVRVP